MLCRYIYFIPFIYIYLPVASVSHFIIVASLTIIQATPESKSFATSLTHILFVSSVFGVVGVQVSLGFVNLATLVANILSGTFCLVNLLNVVPH